MNVVPLESQIPRGYDSSVEEPSFEPLRVNEIKLYDALNVHDINIPLE